MKKILSCLLITVLLFSPAGGLSLHTGAELLLGDANMDGRVDSTDARLALQYYAGLIAKDDIYFFFTDVTGERRVDSTDARLILQYYAGLIDEFPYEPLPEPEPEPEPEPIDYSTYRLSEDKLWGVNAHHKGYPAYKPENIDQIIKLSADMGSTVFRFNYNPANDNDAAYLRSVVNKCHAAGMQFMLVMDNFNGSDQDIAARMAYTAKTFGNDIEFFQIFNETDIWCSMADTGGLYNATDWTGMSTGYYNPNRVSIAVHKMTVALEAFNSYSHTGKTCINISARHYIMLKYYQAAGLTWDVIGVDNYEIWDYNKFFNMLEEEFPDCEFFVVECNYPFRDRLASEKEEADWLAAFLVAIDNLDTDKMLGAIIYELLDQPSIERGSYDGEAHFGIVHTDQNNNPAQPKEAYYRVQQMLGKGEQ